MKANGFKSIIKKWPGIRELKYCSDLYNYYSNSYNEGKAAYIIKNVVHTKVIPTNGTKTDQICKLIKTVRFNKTQNSTKAFFYSIDTNRVIERNLQVLDNYSIDYTWVVNSSFMETEKYLSHNNIHYKKIVDALYSYVNSIKNDKALYCIYKDNISEIESLFTRPAEHFHESLQRILFVNQWLWQSGHKHNGFGHLDWILYDLYKKDLESGYITKEDARQYLRDFFLVLHDKCWFKSTMLLGDTGQIVILGGLGEDDEYRCNDLTYLFIEVSKELKLPDPKVLLRVSHNTPDDLFKLAMECIATGIGAPFISNDDIVIPALIQYGYEPVDAYNYGTSACWEPLTIGKSCDQNNIRTVNFCKPFYEYIESPEFAFCSSIDDVIEGYYKRLDIYLNEFLSELDKKQFEEDPLLTLFSPYVLKQGKDIVKGGAKYANLGVTSVGMSTVVNSMLNLDDFVFTGGKYTMAELDEIRKENYENHEEVRRLLDQNSQSFGHDDERVVELANNLMRHISTEFEKHHTYLGGNYKFGLSSPNYIVDSRNIGATFDGRKANMPFGVHISGKNGLAPTELISFASKLDYSGNRINGNVVDFILSPDLIRKNIDIATTLIKDGINMGFYQLQINVVDSKTLIEAKNNPGRFPNLVVRVWGFSAYFKDLPEEYQDNLIRRALEAEAL